jgi:hypothetical protein
MHKEAVGTTLLAEAVELAGFWAVNLGDRQ